MNSNRRISLVDNSHNPAAANRRHVRRAATGMAAAATAAAMLVGTVAPSANAADALVSGTASKSAEVLETGINTSYIDVIGSTPGTTNAAYAFGVVDFNTSSFTAPVGQTSNNTLNSGNITVGFTNDSYYGASATPFGVNFFLETDTATPLVNGVGLKFDDAAGPGGVGSNTGFASGSSLIPLGSGTYQNPPAAGTTFAYNLSIPTANLSYVNQQLAAGGNLRVLAVANQPSGTVVSGGYTDYVGASYYGATSTTPPSLTVDLSTNVLPGFTFNPTATNDFKFNTTDTNFLNSGGTTSAFTAGGIANFPQSGVGTVTVDPGGVAVGLVNVSNSSGTYTFTGGPINDASANSSGGIVKTGAGTLVLASANGYSGGTNVSSGTLQVGADANLGAASGSVTLGNTATLVATGAITGTRTVNLLAPANGSTGTATINNGGNNLQFGAIFGAKGASVVLTGSGNTTLVGANGLDLFTSGTSIATLSVLGGTLTINQPPATTTNGVTAAGVTSYFNPTTTGGGFTGNVVVASPSRLDLNANGNMSGGGLITVTSPGVLLTLTGGSVTAPLAATVANNIVLNPNNAAGLANGQGAAFTFNLGAAGNTTIGTGTTASKGYSDVLTVTGVISGNSDVNFGSSASATTIDGVAAGSGIVVLAAQNTYAGATRISFGSYAEAGNTNASQPATVQSYGVLRLGVDNALPTTTSVTFGSVNTNAAAGPNVGVLDLYGHSQTITFLSSKFNPNNQQGTTGTVGGIGNFSNQTGGNGLAATLTINGSASTVFSGPIGAIVNNYDANGNVVTGSPNINLTLAPANTGTLELTSPNNYTGTTTINGGTLIASTPATSATTAAAQSGVGFGPLVNNATFNVQVDPSGSLGYTTAAARPQSISGTGTTLVDTASTLTANFVRQSALTVNGSVAINAQSPRPSAAATVSNVGTLTLAGSTNAWTASVNLGNSDLIVRNGDLATVTNQVASGFAGGAWNGPTGIASTAAAADAAHLTALGVIANSATNYASFDGQPVTGAAILVKYTYYGDANLDGVVNAADYARIDAGYVGHLTGWVNGDYNYDGVVDGSDYALMDNAFNQQSASFAASLATAGPSAAVASPTSLVAAVPEPTAMSLLAIGGVGLAGRRRRSATRAVRS